MKDEKTETYLSKIKSGALLKLHFFRDSEKFLDGKYDEIKIEVSYKSEKFYLYSVKSEIFWDAAAGSCPVFSDEEMNEMTEDELKQYLSNLKDASNCVISIE